MSTTPSAAAAHDEVNSQLDGNTAANGHSSISTDNSSTANEQVDGNDERNRVVQLARSFSATRTFSEALNPFLDAKSHAALDPNSPHFNVRLWGSSVMRAWAQDPDKYPRHTAGVSYKNLGVYGYGSPIDYQKDVLNVLWRAPMIAREMVSNRNKKIQVLREFDGLVKSGEMLLVLGRPGSGVSTLLKSISGQMHGLNLDKGSSFNYQGIPWDIMHDYFRGETIYQAENDVHFPMLTVGQILSFAALTRTPKNRLPGVSRELYAEHLRDIVMALFGISHTIDTKIGNEYIRGVSGGERKRVSIAEAMLNQSAIQCWDNSTRGLDSATALEFVKTLKMSTELAGTAAVVAIYQASQPAYDVFDKVALLYEGRQVYFGPASNAKRYFVDMGFRCPERQTTADYLTSLTSPEERIVRPGYEDRVPRTPDEFAERWKKSDEKVDLTMDMQEFDTRYCPEGGDYVEKLQNVRAAQKSTMMRSESPYTISLPMQVKLCIFRGFQRLLGNKLFFVITVLGNFAISLILGSVFYDLPPTTDSMNTRCTVLFFAILFNALSSALEIFALFSQRPIVEKHARYALYHPFSEAIASAVCELPSKIISTIAFNVPLYFMAQLRQSAGHFFTFLLFAFATTLTISMLLRTIGQVSQSVHQALAPAAFLILALVIYTGFILPTPKMQGWLRWINYIDPIAYSYEALLANEFSGRQFPCEAFVPAYPDVDATRRTCSVAGAAPGTDFVLGDVYIEGAFGYRHSHLWRNFGILAAFFLFFTATYLLSAEYLSITPSKGEVLLFRRGHALLESRAEQGDEEKGGQATTPPGRDASTASTPGMDVKLYEQQVVFHWKDLCYAVPIKATTRQILSDVSGWVKPGTLTALMARVAAWSADEAVSNGKGATGAGKTTLLDVLANRVRTGIVTGDVRLDGYLRGHSFQRKTGYVQQQDIHLETSTVREALRFSAELRQPASTSLHEKHEFAEGVIKLLDMELYADAVVGVPGEGLNVEQRKRLTIGVELAAKPELLLFLDEPTSGLDSQTAWSIARLIRKLSDNGQAILCTIHQPSAILFQQFDRLLLLAQGGRTVYFGDIGRDSTVLESYFERNGGRKCGKDENPAEWMLEVIGAAPGAHTTIDWPEVWKNSEEHREMRRELDVLEKRKSTKPNPDSDANHAGKKYAAPLSTQLMACTKRVFQQYSRTPSYIYSKLTLCGAMSIFIGVSFYKSDLSMQGMQHQMFSIFMLLVVFAFLVYQTMPVFVAQRDLYEARERSSRTYAWYVFIVSNILVELPWTSLASALVFAPFYYLVGMNANGEGGVEGGVAERSGLMFLVVWSFMIFESTFADMVIAGAPTADIGATISLLLFSMTLIFCGVLVPSSALPGFWIFMYRVSPFTYIISDMMAIGVANNIITCDDIELLAFQPAQNTTCGQYMQPYVEAAGTGEVYNPQATSDCLFCPMTGTNAYLAQVNVEWDHRRRNVGLIWVYVAFNVAAALGLYWLARVPKKSEMPGISRLRGWAAWWWGGKWRKSVKDELSDAAVGKSGADIQA